VQLLMPSDLSLQDPGLLTPLEEDASVASDLLPPTTGSVTSIKCFPSKQLRVCVSALI
jgi:hypothetical protein